MTSNPESGTAPGDPPRPIKPITPKRGAFPTPKPEIEKATPYIPGAGEAVDPDEKNDPETKSEPPKGMDGEKER
jgi:hypothetical protein